MKKDLSKRNFDKNAGCRWRQKLLCREYGFGMKEFVPDILVMNEKCVRILDACVVPTMVATVGSTYTILVGEVSHFGYENACCASLTCIHKVVGLICSRRQGTRKIQKRAFVSRIHKKVDL